MIKRTFGSVKSELARVAGQSGMPVDDARLREIVFLAQERLCTKGEWPFQYDRLKFKQYDCVVSLPSEYESLVHTSLDRVPVEIQPPWFEFLENGPGPQDRDGWVNLGIDLGEWPVFWQPGSEGSKVRLVSTSGDDSGQVTVVGYDTDGLAQSLGLDLPDITTEIELSKITQVVKPVTAGDVVLSYVDEFGEESIAATYRARDTNPTFRTYRFPTISDEGTVVHGIARRRLYPITSDNDELLVPNLGALRLAVKGIAFEDNDKVIEAANCFALATEILREEAKLYRGSRNTAPVNVSRVSRLSVRPDIF